MCKFYLEILLENFIEFYFSIVKARVRKITIFCWNLLHSFMDDGEWKNTSLLKLPHR